MSKGKTSTKSTAEIYDTDGNKQSGYIKDGKTYRSDGSRIPAGWTVKTKGGTYTMGEDGKSKKTSSGSGQKKSTVFFDERGYKQDGYMIDGKAYLPNGERVPQGWSVQTAGGVFKMGEDGKGYKSDSGHNRPNAQQEMDDLIAKYMEQSGDYKWNPEKDYGQLGEDLYKPIYDQQYNALQAQREQALADLANSEGSINTNYDRALERQEEATRANQVDHDQQMLARGMGRSSYATKGKSAVNIQGQRQMADIDMDRGNALNEIRSKIDNVKMNIGNQMGSLQANKGIEEMKMGMQLEDRDRDNWFREAQLGQNMQSSMFGARQNALMMDFQQRMGDYDYYRDLERSMNSFRGDTPEGLLYNRGRDRYNQESKDDFWNSHDLSQEALKRRYEKGYVDYDNRINMRDEDRQNQLWGRDNITFPTMDKQHKQSMASSRAFSGGGGGGGYTWRGGNQGGSSRSSSGGASTRSGVNNVYSLALQGNNYNNPSYRVRDAQDSFRKAGQDGHMSQQQANQAVTQLYNNYRRDYGYPKSSKGGGTIPYALSKIT